MYCSNIPIYFISVILVLFLVDSYNLALAKDIVIIGHIKCKKPDDPVPFPANNILVIPERYLPKTVLSDSIGHYELTLPGKIKDKNIVIVYMDESKKVFSKDITIWGTSIKPMERRQVFFVEPPIELPITCEEILSNQSVMEEKLSFFHKEPKEADKLLEHTSAGLLGGSGFVALLASFAPLAAGGGPPPLPPPILPVQVTGISAQRIKAGSLTSYAQSAFLDNFGFSFVPSRDYSTAVFSNSSAIASSYFSQLMASANFNEGFYSASGSFPVGDIFGFGIGYMTFRNEDARTGFLTSGTSISNEFSSREDAVFLGAGLKVAESEESALFIGMTGKLLYQNLDNPTNVAFVESSDGKFSSWEHAEETRERYDIDVSAMYKIKQNLTFGINVTSLAGGMLLAESGKEVAQRGVGIGVNYQWNKIQFGSDLKWRQEQGVNGAFGLNYIPLNNCLIHIGYDSTYRTFATKAEIGWAFYSYRKSDLFGGFHTFGLNIKL